MKKFLGMVVSAGIFMMSLGSYVAIGLGCLSKAAEISKNCDTTNKRSKAKASCKILGLFAAAGYFFYHAHVQANHIDEISEDYFDSLYDSEAEEECNSCLCNEDCECDCE